MKISPKHCKILSTCDLGTKILWQSSLWLLLAWSCGNAACKYQARRAVVNKPSQAICCGNTNLWHKDYGFLWHEQRWDIWSESLQRWDAEWTRLSQPPSISCDAWASPLEWWQPGQTLVAAGWCNCPCHRSQHAIPGHTVWCKGDQQATYPRHRLASSLTRFVTLGLLSVGVSQEQGLIISVLNPVIQIML